MDILVGEGLCIIKTLNISIIKMLYFKVLLIKDNGKWEESTAKVKCNGKIEQYIKGFGKMIK